MSHTSSKSDGEGAEVSHTSSESDGDGAEVSHTNQILMGWS